MKKVNSQLLWISLSLLLVALSVSCGQSDLTVSPEVTEITMTIENLLATDTEAPTKTPQITLSVTATEVVQSPTVIPTDEPRKMGISLSLSKEALSNADTIPAQTLNIKEEVFFLCCFGGGGELISRLATDSELPVIGYYQYPHFGSLESAGLVLVGFSNDQPLEISLYDPNGDFVASQVIEKSNLSNTSDYIIKEMDGHYVLIEDYFGTETEDQKSIVFRDVTEVLIRFRNLVGLPHGQWKVIAESKTQTKEGMFNVYREDEAISVLGDQIINPLIAKDSYCDEYNVGDLVYIAGTNFQPNSKIPIGLYIETSIDASAKGGDGNIGKKIFGAIIDTSNDGDFIFTYQIQPDDPHGYVQVATTKDMEEGLYPTGHGFCINNEDVNPESLYTTSSLDTDFCPGVLPAELEVGDIASVSLVPPDPNIVREKAGKQEKRLGLIQPGEKVELLKGPKCVDGWIWWKVKSLKTGLTGWTAQGDHQHYWLIPDG